MKTITFGIERKNEILIANISSKYIHFRYKRLYDNGIIGELLNTGSNHFYNYIHYKNILVIFDNNKLNRWIIYDRRKSKYFIKKYYNSIFYNNELFVNKVDNNYNYELLIDKFNEVENIEKENQLIFNYFINKYQELYSQVNNKERFQQEILCCFDDEQYFSNKKQELEESFEDLIINFINAENDIKNKNTIFTLEALLLYFPDLKFAEEINLLQECIKTILDSECGFDIFYSREEIFYAIYKKFQDELDKKYIKQQEYKNYLGNKSFENFSEQFLSVFNNKTIIKLTEEKEERFIKHKIGKFQLKDIELFEYELIYTIIMDLYKSKFFYKKTNKPKPTYLNLDKKYEFVIKIINCLCKYGVLNDNDNVYFNYIENFAECANEIFELNCE